jgi:hypothetical protein
MPMLCTQLDVFNSIAEDEQGDLFPLLECISSVVLALGSGVLPYAVRVYQKGIELAEQSLQLYLVRAWCCVDFSFVCF